MKEFFSESLYFGLTISIGAYGLGLLARKKLKWGVFESIAVSDRCSYCCTQCIGC